MESFIKAFVAYFVIVDPVGTAMIFNGLTKGKDGPYTRRMARRSVFFSTLLVLFFGFWGMALLGVLGAGALMTGFQWLAIPGVVAAGFEYANIWPMLFSITIEDKPECANELSGLMCMAISGGAVLPLLMGWFLDLGWEETAYIVPALCFVYLLLLSIRGGSKPADTSFARDPEEEKAA